MFLLNPVEDKSKPWQPEPEKKFYRGPGGAEAVLEVVGVALVTSFLMQFLLGHSAWSWPHLSLQCFHTRSDSHLVPIKPFINFGFFEACCCL